jgi:hypothetical protein
MRIKKIMLEAQMKTFCKLMGKKMGFEEGCWNLEYYGGWNIVEFLENGAERYPIFNKRMAATQMFDFLYGVNAVLTIQSRGE